MRFNHIKHAISGFVLVVAAYWAYVAVAVPWIEPRVERKSTPTGPRTQAPSTNRYRAELSKLFAPGSWELDKPKVLRSEQATLLLQEYRTLPNGRLELKPCTVVFHLSKGPQKDRQDALILQAPEGAVLVFDQALNLRRAEFGGRPIGGQLVGPVSIRSVGRQPSDSELYFETSNVQITRQRILTRERVEFRMGPNRGSGSELMLTLSEEVGKGSVEDRLLGGLKSVELQRLESLHLELDGDLFSSDTSRKAVLPIVQAPPVPVEVSCDGPLRIDLEGLIATLEQRVLLQRINRDMPPDRLDCDRLSLHFSRNRKTVRAAASATQMNVRGRETRAQRAARASRTADDTQTSQVRDQPFAVKRVVATGNPVTIEAPSRSARFRGERLEYDLETRRIQMKGVRPLDSGDQTRMPAIFQDADHFVAAPTVEYVAGARGTIGRFFASGPGKYRGSPRPGELPAFEAEWKKQVSLRPIQGGHELQLEGGVRAAGTEGHIAAEMIQMTLSEIAKSQVGRNSSQRTRLEPRQFVAVAPTSGFVKFDSPQMSGSLRKLTVMLRPESVPSAPPTATESGILRLSPGSPTERAAKANAKYHVQGGEVAAVLDRGRKTEVRFVQIDGNAHVVQTQGVAANQQPLELTGDSVQIKRPPGEQGLVLVKGSPAIVKANELELRGHDIRLDADANRLAIDGAGSMRLPLPAEFRGNGLPPGGRVRISWRGGMDFDGEIIKYQDQVVVAGPQQQMRTGELHVRLDRRISFSQPPKDARSIKLLTLHALGDTFLTNHRVDPATGLQSVDRLDVRDLSLNQQTGELLASGPGWIASTLPRGSISLPGSKPEKNEARQPAAGGETPLSFVNITFQDQIVGNIHRREVHLRNQIEAIYGPVSSLDERLDPRAALRPNDTRLSCDELTVLQLGPTQDSLELLARGNTFVETQTFAARGHQIKYARSKNMLILEGDGRQAAELFRRGKIGGPVMRHAANRILYWPELQQVEIDGGRYLDVSNLPGLPDTRR